MRHPQDRLISLEIRWTSHIISHDVTSGRPDGVAVDRFLLRLEVNSLQLEIRRPLQSSDLARGVIWI
jgi:hypothetical protein